MAYPIIFLNDEGRETYAGIFAPQYAAYHGESEKRKLTKRETRAVEGVLRAALLAVCWQDNRFSNPEQVAWAMECAATYIPALEKFNSYDLIFIPVMHMLKALHEQYEKEGTK